MDKKKINAASLSAFKHLQLGQMLLAALGIRASLKTWKSHCCLLLLLALGPSMQIAHFQPVYGKPFPIRSTCLRLRGSGSAAWEPQEHARANEDPTCADLRNFARWRSWARRQDGDIVDTLAGLRVCVVCLNNTVSKVVESVLRQSADLVVCSRLLGGGNPSWYLSGSWENIGLEGRSLHHGRPPDKKLATAAATRGFTLEGYSRPLMREDIDQADVLIAFGDDAHALLYCAALAWGGEDLWRRVEDITRFVPSASIPCMRLWRRGGGGGGEGEREDEIAQLLVDQAQQFTNSHLVPFLLEKARVLECANRCSIYCLFYEHVLIRTSIGTHTVCTTEGQGELGGRLRVGQLLKERERIDR